MKTHEVVVWTPLVGFEKNDPDRGVARFLALNDEKPDGVALFLFSPDIVHQHTGMAEPRVLPKDNCHYHGSERNEIREIQEWSSYDLQQLCQNLKGADVKNYLGLMGCNENDRFHHEWLNDHPECQYLYKTGRGGSLNVLSRLADGRLYEDFFLEKLLEVVQDYGFDGLHVADLFCPPGLSICEGDFSTSFVEQFLAQSRVVFPPQILAALGCDELDAVCERGNYIWNNLRFEWIEFHAWRWESFWTKICTALHAIGKKVTVNNAWCSEPMEAIYRFGIDYKRFYRAGIDAIMPETVPNGVFAASKSWDGIMDATYRYYQYMTMAMYMKAYVPEGKLLCLNGIKDATEQWDMLSHYPSLVERDIYTLSSYYLKGKNGVTRCVDGMFVCLGDGLTQREWSWLNSRYIIGFGEIPVATTAPTLLWSDVSIENLLKDYAYTKRFTSHKILYEIQKAGTLTGFVTRFEDIDCVDGPVFVPNADLCSIEEQEALAGYKKGPVMVVAKAGYKLPGMEPDMYFEDPFAQYQLSASVYHFKTADKCAIRELLKDSTGKDEIEGDPYFAKDPAYFQTELTFCKVSNGFIKACAALLRETAGDDIVADSSILVNYMTDGRARIIAVNDDRLSYIKANIVCKRSIQKIQAVSKFPALPPHTIVDENGKAKGFKGIVPPGGLSIFDVWFEE